MNTTNRHADYDQIARGFDSRYEREQYAGVERALQQFVGSEPGLRILEVGCGTGHWLKSLRAQFPENILSGIDFSREMLARARAALPEVDLVRGTAQRLPWQDGSFDRVYCINALHHFPDKPAFLAEARRLLRPGGQFFSVGIDPHGGMDQWYIYDYFKETLALDRQRYPSTQELREWMTAAGFEDCLTEVVEHWEMRIPARDALEHGWLAKAVTSQLSILTNDEYQQGIQRIEEGIERAEKDGRILSLQANLRLHGTSGSATR